MRTVKLVLFKSDASGSTGYKFAATRSHDSLATFYDSVLFAHDFMEHGLRHRSRRTGSRWGGWDNIADPNFGVVSELIAIGGTLYGRGNSTLTRNNGAVTAKEVISANIGNIWEDWCRENPHIIHVRTTRLDDEDEEDITAGLDEWEAKTRDYLKRHANEEEKEQEANIPAFRRMAHTFVRLGFRAARRKYSSRYHFQNEFRGLVRAWEEFQSDFMEPGGRDNMGNQKESTPIYETVYVRRSPGGGYSIEPSKRDMRMRGYY